MIIILQVFIFAFTSQLKCKKFNQQLIQSIKIFCMFVVRDILKLNNDATNIKEQTTNLGRRTVESTEVLSEHRFGMSRSDLPSFINFNPFIMRDKLDKCTTCAENPNLGKSKSLKEIKDLPSPERFLEYAFQYLEKMNLYDDFSFYVNLQEIQS